MIFDTSLARQQLLHTLYTQLLANHITNSQQPRMSPPPYRMPLTSNPFGYLNPSGAVPPHGAVLGSDGHSLSLVGQQSPGARNWFGPPPTASGGPGGPHFSPPAARPPGPVPLPR